MIQFSWEFFHQNWDFFLPFPIGNWSVYRNLIHLMCFFFQGREEYLNVLNKSGISVHGTVYMEQTENSENIPDYVINHGLLNGEDLHGLLRQAKVCGACGMWGWSGMEWDVYGDGVDLYGLLRLTKVCGVGVGWSGMFMGICGYGVGWNGVFIGVGGSIWTSEIS